eukprot:TRINITY_DN1927_c0_g1_i22.p1 TRINITY_DN1927_c0_g1~~TRINITY_DN1927_c0_g1_i22.p1  ORF type:complete len:156 (-),score=28.84 TRINITY_DN1927_c0_g1_i22:73-540(-)
MIRRPPRSTQSRSSAASDVYKRQGINAEYMGNRFLRNMADPINNFNSEFQSSGVRTGGPEPDESEARRHRSYLDSILSSYRESSGIHAEIGPSFDPVKNALITEIQHLESKKKELEAQNQELKHKNDQLKNEITKQEDDIPVSYTHLTLPTIYSV